MILNCPACSAKFLVPDAAFAKGGRQVKCGKCQHGWFAELPAEQMTKAAANDAVKDNSFEDVKEHPTTTTGDEPPRSHAQPHDYDENQLPVVVETATVAPWMWGITGVMAATVVLLAILVSHPDMSKGGWYAPFYKLFGITNTNGVMLTDLDYQKIETSDGTRYKINCAVQNTAEGPRDMPVLRLQLISRTGDVLMEESDGLLPPRQTINPGEKIVCDIPSPPLRFGSAQQFVLDIGAPANVRQRARAM